ncbi:hypothetical protein AB0E10_12530 [Streptomyces sp. NPDC048045]|uniref:hypothetical protein n=1 Tax=Streptomyces sp. NPDC048045 TaxID=3154710 RepID=UPI003434A40D
MTSSNSHQGMPFNTAAADVRSSIMSVLASWAGLIAEERGVAAPQRQVVGLARFLHENIPWLSVHSAAHDLIEELTTLTRLARRASDSRSVRVIPVGTCVRAGCTGRLHAVVKVVPGTQAKPSEIRCSADRAHWWACSEWAALSTRMQTLRDHRRTWYSVADIEVLWKIPSGSIYRLASQYQWRRRKVSGRVFYHAEDLHSALGS